MTEPGLSVDHTVDSGGQTVDFCLSKMRDREDATIFLKKTCRIRTIGRLAFSAGTDCAAILRPSGICKGKSLACTLLATHSKIP